MVIISRWIPAKQLIVIFLTTAQIFLHNTQLSSLQLYK